MNGEKVGIAHVGEPGVFIRKRGQEPLPQRPEGCFAQRFLPPFPVGLQWVAAGSSPVSYEGSIRVSLPRFLILETSGQAGVVALGEGPVLAGVRRLDEARRHARDLAPAVAELLTGLGWQPREIAGVIVTRGPGSYTGLRVGLMSAKAFAYATGCTLLSLETFAILAAQVPADVSRLAVVADAQQDKIYVQEFARPAAGESLSAVSPLVIQPLAAWLEKRGGACWITGPGLGKIADKLPADVVPVGAAQWYPLPQTLLQLGWMRYQKGERDDVLTVEPLYLRPSAAEEQWSRRLRTDSALG
jgi:tRNA threonylcarbamoyladenosine biosynthesis protein TsaB